MELEVMLPTSAEKITDGIVFFEGEREMWGFNSRQDRENRLKAILGTIFLLVRLVKNSILRRQAQKPSSEATLGSGPW